MHLLRRLLKRLGMRREVINKMAIDYKKEWEKLKKTYGCNAIVYSGAKGMPTLGDLMEAQIKKTIGKRESLMKEYLKSSLRTNIAGGDKACHYVDVRFHEHVFGIINIPKADFAAWCKKKGGK